MKHVFKSDTHAQEGPARAGFLPQQIYEICIPEGDYKNYLIAQLTQGYPRCKILREDQHFRSLEELIVVLATLRGRYDLLIIDISELSYVESVHDLEIFQKDFAELHTRLGPLTKLGTPCVLFLNYIWYQEIYYTVARPAAITLKVHQSDVPYFWEAEVINPPELAGRTTLFSPFRHELPIPFSV